MNAGLDNLYFIIIIIIIYAKLKSDTFILLIMLSTLINFVAFLNGA